jgi:hypothetical protein
MYHYIPRAELSGAERLPSLKRAYRHRQEENKHLALRRSFNLWWNVSVRWLSGTPTATETQGLSETEMKWKCEHIYIYEGWDWSVQACRGRWWCFFLCPPTMAFFHILIHRLNYTHKIKKLWLFDDPLWLNRMSKLYRKKLSPTLSRSSPSCCLNWFLARKNSPKFCPTWKNPLNLASSTLHLYQHIWMHINPVPASAHIPMASPWSFVSPHSRNIHEAPFLFLLPFFSFFFLH